MKFIYSKWESFCKMLSQNGIHSITAAQVLEDSLAGVYCEKSFFNIKHDVESHPQKALLLARIESKYGHKSSYYVQAYLMVESNIPLFKEIQSLGHEVSYHHDVMDCGKGDINEALSIFEQNRQLFAKYGFNIRTVCQHGNPMSSYENRDFFRDMTIQSLYPNLSDIMVDFTQKIHREYVYISDVGMTFKIVNDPVNSDKKQSDEKYILIGDLEHVYEEIMSHPNQSYIVSSHPHRYYKSAFVAGVRKCIFNVIRYTAKVLFKIPGLKNVLFRFNAISKHL